MTSNEEEMITITLKEYNDLKRSELELMRLDDAGVDNWEWNYMRYRDENGDFEDE